MSLSDDLPETVFRIHKWSEVFERAESRKLKTLNWIAVPVNFSSTGYQTLLEDFQPMEAVAIYGAWCALCQFAATCSVRGVLASSRGIPLRVSHIARVTGLPAEVFARLIEWASRPDVGWLERVTVAEIVSESSGVVDNSLRIATTGESPDDLPATQTNPPSTRPDRTIQDTTVPNPTIPDQRRTDGWAGRWSAADFAFKQRVWDVATRLLNCRFKTLDRDLIWRIAWVGVEFDVDGVNDAISRSRSPEVKNPRNYLGSAMVKMCAKHGEDWDVLKRLVPPPPPPTPTKVTIVDDTERQLQEQA